MECLAIIPARGGSKGIPRKNIQLVAGKPLLAYAIEQALASQWVSRVVVSTDDAEIAGVAHAYGAEVVHRPDAISGDTASSEAALLHALAYLERTEAYVPDLVVFLQCTSPLTLAEDIDGTVATLVEHNADSALAVIPFHYFLWRRDANNEAEGINHDKHVRLLRQQKEPEFLETGAVYVMRTPGFKAAQHRFFGKTALYVMPAERRLEIDEPFDLQLAETLLLHRQKAAKQAALPKPVAALVLDFDGVFTDNKVTVFQDGHEAVRCDRGDGMGLEMVQRAGLPVWVLSTETNPVVKARCDKLGVSCFYGLGMSKREKLVQLLDQHGLKPERVVYVGNDVNDLACMGVVGCSVAVADAHPSVIAKADIVLAHRGGDGAIREVCELMLDSGHVSDQEAQ